MINVPFSYPPKCTDDFKSITSAINQGQVVGNGPFTQKAEILLKEQLHNKGEILLTTSCTHALEMAAILLDISPGDEIIVPSYTFVSSALAFYMRGAKIVFVDIRADTLNIDVSKLEDLVTDRTRAIVAVHYGGIACEMDELITLSLKYGIHIIEDNAHGLYGKYRGKYLGSIGSMGTQSFHGTKNISCGEGGALILNNPDFFERAHVIREKGTNRSKFLDGKVDKYTWVDKGSSYVMSDILAALLFSQLNFSDSIQSRRKQIWETYNNELKKWAGNLSILLPYIPSYCNQAYHLFYLVFPNGDTRNAFINFMASKNITVTSHYQPLHSSDFMQKIPDNQHDSCPVTTRVSNCIARLPLFFNMSDEQLQYVIEKIHDFEF
tara:strand:- start:531 stop:1670 length:1140 start_codon:yes stop_codon:yes gene_type:complete